MLVEPGRDSAALIEQLRAGLRNSQSTLADFTAQCSANLRRLERLATLARALHDDTLAATFERLNAHAETMARRKLARLRPGRYVARDFMDGDARAAGPIPIVAAVDINAEAVVVDFTGTSPRVDSNINCPLSVTAAAVYYVFYCLKAPGTPACAGSLRPVTLRAPAGCLVNAQAPAAVAAENVATSQRLVGVLLMALLSAAPTLMPAASADTMNNVAMGGAHRDYYETIGGGGAGCRGPGLDARQTHMTTTLNTSIEIFESVYPARITPMRCDAVRAAWASTGAVMGGCANTSLPQRARLKSAASATAFPTVRGEYSVDQRTHSGRHFRAQNRVVHEGHAAIPAMWVFDAHRTGPECLRYAISQRRRAVRARRPPEPAEVFELADLSAGFHRRRTRRRLRYRDRSLPER